MRRGFCGADPLTRAAGYSIHPSSFEAEVYLRPLWEKVGRVHAQALAATDPDQINGLSRTHARIARSLRQTVALKAKLARDAREAAPRRRARAR